jgi:N6-adenosine-specific RNA methylase IME4
MRYQTIVADPPWPYKAATAMPIREGLAKHRGTASGHGSSVMQYGSMSLVDLASLPVKDVVANNAHLYLWVTNSFMEQAYPIARAWGFKPKTIVTWVKIRKSDGQPSMKMGYYYRGATEHCLFCVRGKLRLYGPPAATAFFTHRSSHSVKPAEFYTMAEQQSPAPRLEMFARKERQGWASWGNEIQNSVELT